MVSRTVRATKALYSSGGFAVVLDEAHVGLDAGDDAEGLDEVVEGHVAAEPAPVVDVPQDVFDLARMRASISRGSR